MTPSYLELVCPAGTPASLRAAIDAGADTVYCGFRNCTNARNYPGLNFDQDELVEGIAYAHERGRKVLVAINTFPRAGDEKPWHQAVDNAAEARADAIILADIGVLDYATRHQPSMRRHLSVQASAANALSIAFYRDHFDVKRVVLPRVLYDGAVPHQRRCLRPCKPCRLQRRRRLHQVLPWLRDAKQIF